MLDVDKLCGERLHNTPHDSMCHNSATTPFPSCCSSVLKRFLCVQSLQAYCVWSITTLPVQWLDCSLGISGMWALLRRLSTSTLTIPSNPGEPVPYVYHMPCAVLCRATSRKPSCCRLLHSTACITCSNKHCFSMMCLLCVLHLLCCAEHKAASKDTADSSTKQHA